ncbi:sulfurtransferase [Corynebacterium timonense]|uniref:Thiosulfate/3-mercaptopyruvate sulfurtransferase n=1 Tax=Corynebacterium timonense TaxID=441500 RepID=A0A1H1VIK6_9CORY|nr:rhodanese-like domain-containing protein [Corynebacterium timonense]SDS84774.1 thiosulfate/3-mercaptopyruvate sulfurtransferase [Corynebacterium timonense]
MSVFVPAEQLRERIHTGKNQTIIAALWEPEEGKAWSKFQSEHIPTAKFCDPSAVLSGLPGRRVGRNPLPHLDVVVKAVRSWGVDKSRPTFIYDTGSGLFAARAWWLLRWLGIDDVFIVDGGFRAWDAAGLETIAGPGNLSVAAHVEPSPGALPVATLEDVKEFTGLLIDARGARRYSGRREIFDLKAGHIPGALNLPATDLFSAETGEVVSAAEIRERAATVGLTVDSDPAGAIAYSGSGNHSALLLAALAHAGLPVVTHFVGGWSQWAGDAANPVATDL